MSAEREPTFDELTAAVVDGSLDAAGAQHLLRLCRDDAELRERFSRQVDVDRLLEMALGDMSGVSFGEEVIERIRRDDGDVFVAPVMGRLQRISTRRRWGKRIALAGMAAAVAAMVGWWALAPISSAHLHRDDAARWTGQRPAERLVAGARLILESGLAEIHFVNGAELILEGPADLEIRGPGAGWLRAGKVAVHVPERAIGFTLDSPGGRVIDLGTSFGVSVEADGATETQVFEGKVKIRPKGKQDELILVENETFAVTDQGGNKTAGARESTFVTGLPPRAADHMPYVHWSMNEGQGLKVGAMLYGGVTDPVPAELRMFDLAQGLPKWIDGPFGKALSFNGRGQAMETFHMGPVGDSARTITFWVRVPKDFDPMQGYGIISWGKLPEAGRAWQISANPFSGKSSAEGRLRVSVGYSDVVGVTDLRDGKWHHCAVVLYQDKKRPDRFPVLIYVDGKMEAAKNKAVHGVRTAGGDGAREIWLGRSLGHGRPDRPHHGTGFFRGDLDEVYVFEGSLNRKQIEELMLHNRPPDG